MYTAMVLSMHLHKTLSQNPARRTWRGGRVPSRGGAAIASGCGARAAVRRRALRGGGCGCGCRGAPPRAALCAAWVSATGSDAPCPPARSALSPCRPAHCCRSCTSTPALRYDYILFNDFNYCLNILNPENPKDTSTTLGAPAGFHPLPPHVDMPRKASGRAANAGALPL